MKNPTPKEVSAAAAAMSAARKTHGGGRPAIKKKCKFCKLPFSAREMWTHKAKCKALHNPEEANVPRPGRPLGWRKGAKKRVVKKKPAAK